MKAKRKSPVALQRSAASPLAVSDVSVKTHDTTHDTPIQAVTDLDELLDRFAPKHSNSIALSECYERLGYVTRAERVSECGSFLEFAHEIAEGKVAEHGKLYTANFCRDRLCPMCTWRRSLKIFGQVSSILDEIRDKYKFILLTLTVISVPGELLRDTISRMMWAFNRLMGYADIKAVCKGWFRCLEVTYNEEADTYHPHFHVIIAVPKSYGKGECYIKQREWLDMWRKAYKDPRITQVDVRLVRPKQSKDKSILEQSANGADYNLDKIDLSAAVAEVTKYTLKFTDLKSDKVVYFLANALKGRRLVAYGGVFKEVFNQLKMQDAEADNADLTHIEDKIDPLLSLMICQYGWKAGAYRLNNVRIVHKYEFNEVDQ